MAMFIMIQTSIASTTGVITYDTVRVRRDPEQDLTKTKTYALVSIGDKVEVLAKEGNWYKITCTYEGKQITGYVREDLIDVKDPEKLETSSNNNNNNTNSNNNSNSNSNGNDNDNNNNNSNNNSNEDPSTSNPNTSNENNPTEQPNNPSTPTTEQLENSSDTTLTTIKLGQNKMKEGNKIKLTSDTNIKILPVVNSTNIGKITSGTEVTVVEVVNKWVRIETEELIGWARVE